jgi:hypothetical protein
MPTTTTVGVQAGDGLVIGFPGMRTAAGPCPGMGLRLLERGAGAFQVISGNYDFHAPERGVGKIDVDVSVGELAGQLAEGHGPVLDVDHQDLALVGDPYPSAPERRPASGHGLAVQEHVDNTPAISGEGRKATDTDTGFASDLPQPGQFSGLVLKNHCQVRRHRVLIFPPRRAPGQSSRHRTAGRYAQATRF